MYCFQAQQKKADGLPDPNKREGPVKTAKDIYEEGGLGVCVTCLQVNCHILMRPRHAQSKHNALVNAYAISIPVQAVQAQVLCRLSPWILLAASLHCFSGM